MADIKISALPTATTPLTGAELVPIVQSGVTKQTTATAIFTAGVLPVVNGGTGSSTLTANNVLLGNGTSALQVVAPGTSGNILTSNGTTWASSVPAPGGITYSKYTSNVTAVDKQGVIADTTAGSFTVTLPATPTTGNQVVVVDGGNWATNNLIIGRNGSTIESIAEDMTVDIGGVAITFIYNGTTWDIYSQLGVVPTTAGSFTTLAASSTVSGAGFTNYFASPPALGGTAANAVSATTLSASSTVSGTGFSAYLASPPAIGGTTPAAGTFTSLNTGQLAGLRNKIINGGMTIDQRNAGAAVTVNTTVNVYVLDRFAFAGQVTDGVYTVQQSTTVPSKFKNAAIVTVTTADASIGATQSYLISQFVEGLNVYDLAWGTASAAPITLSFWVRSSVTGTFGGAIQNNALDRSYPFSFTISAANTYEYKTITIAGDTSGTWLTDSGRGLTVRFSLGVGSTYKGTANAWAAANYFAPTGSVDLISTNAATLYLTGIQLELGSVATPFEQRPYGMELGLCQRYLPVLTSGTYASGYCISTTQAYVMPSLQVYPRVAPTGITTSVSGNLYSGTTGIALTAITYVGASSNTIILTGTVASGLTLGNGTMLYTANPIFLTGCEL